MCMTAKCIPLHRYAILGFRISVLLSARAWYPWLLGELALQSKHFTNKTITRHETPHTTRDPISFFMIKI